METLKELQQELEARTNEELAEYVERRDSNLASWSWDIKASVLATVQKIQRTGVGSEDFWGVVAWTWLAGDSAERLIVDRAHAQMEANTAPATGPSRRQGRL